MQCAIALVTTGHDLAQPTDAAAQGGEVGPAGFTCTLVVPGRQMAGCEACAAARRRRASWPPTLALAGPTLPGARLGGTCSLLANWATEGNSVHADPTGQ